MKVYYDKDANLKFLQKRAVAVFGYGSQGHAHAHNLRDSGVAPLVAVREGGESWRKAKKAGFTVCGFAQAAKKADLLMLLLPDELQPEIYREHIASHAKKGAAIGFAHGFNIHFSQIEARPDLDVLLVAPKGPGHLVRATFASGGGVPCLIAAHQNPSGGAKKIALAYASAIGGGRAGVIETTFREETETDLFGEQAVLCGGVSALVEAGFETLVEAGYAPEMAYFECLHELKLIVDLLYEGGMADMRYSISNTAEYGDVTRGPRLINAAVRAEMKKIMAEIQSGEFAREFVLEYQTNQATLKAARRRARAHPIEEVGKKLRAMMPWIGKSRLVDRDQN